MTYFLGEGLVRLYLHQLPLKDSQKYGYIIIAKEIYLKISVLKYYICKSIHKKINFFQTVQNNIRVLLLISYKFRSVEISQRSSSSLVFTIL